jgi:ubiquitin C-terminal hydrolase
VDDEGKKHHVATTRMVFSKLPQILMISFDRKSHVKILETLLIDNKQYDLISTALHVGDQHDGHYVSFVKRRNKWFLMNDEHMEAHELPGEGGFYLMVYNLKTPSSQYSP